MTIYKLQRTGKPMLRFEGELLFDTNEGWKNDSTRWHNLRLYRTKAGGYVLCIIYCSRYRGESAGHHLAEVCETPAEVIKHLYAYRVEDHIQGYPEGPQFHDRQRRLIADVRRQFDDQLTELLMSDETFTERVE